MGLLTFLPFLALFIAHSAAEEYFSSVDKLETLAINEMHLLQDFEQFVLSREQEISKQRLFVEKIKREHAEARKNLKEYIQNPLNSFRLIRRMTLDWNFVETKLNENTAAKDDFLRKLQGGLLLGQGELLGAIESVHNLEKTYALSPKDLAKGVILGQDYGHPLDWQDCHEMATYYYYRNATSKAIEWFEVTIAKLKDDRNATNVNWPHKRTKRQYLIKNLYLLALASYMAGDVPSAIRSLDEVLLIEPNHEARDLKRTFLERPPSNQLHWRHKLLKLCKGEQQPEPWLSRLKCKVETKGRAYFVLAPLKIEELSLDPEVNLYHGLLQDAQIKQVLDEAHRVGMQRSEVGQGGNRLVLGKRISQHSWLPYNSNVTKYMHKLASELLGLHSLKHVEPMQVATYGIGGQFGPHVDFLGEYSVEMGDRMTTQLFYLSDVEFGGYTVFPYLNVVVRPEKGSMVMWHNVHYSLHPCHNTMHAGCPVLKGIKRVATIWSSSIGQEFSRPCQLRPDSYKSILYRFKSDY